MTGNGPPAISISTVSLNRSSYYPEEIEIKENWEVVNPWELVLKNSKETKLQIIKTGTR